MSTPGPWKVSNGVVYPEASGYGPYAIAKMDQDSGNPIPPTERDSNAHLISAAPELLEIAKLILKEWEAPTEDVTQAIDDYSMITNALQDLTKQLHEQIEAFKPLMRKAAS